MTDRPVIFSGAMVLAMLSDAKTQTRRLASSPLAKCVPGDRLYVREAFGDVNLYGAPGILYRADKHRWALMDDPTYLCDDGSMNYDHPHGDKYLWAQWVDDLESGAEGNWRPSIHMPRWVSRLWLSVTDVTFEALQDLTDDAAEAEGMISGSFGWDGTTKWAHAGAWRLDEDRRPHAETAMLANSPKHAFAKLWDTLHGSKQGEAWSDNPDVVALTYTVHRGNIDGGDR